MLRRLFCSRDKSNASSPNSIYSQPHAGAATASWSECKTPDERDIAQARISAEIFLAEKGQRLLKQHGDVSKVIRRQRGRYFRPEKTAESNSRGRSFDCMIDEDGRDWSPAVVWAQGLDYNPLWMDEEERKSVTLPDWAVSTAIQAMEGKYTPTMFDWAEPPKSPVLVEESSTPHGEFVRWCEYISNTAFGLTSDEVDQETDDELDTDDELENGTYKEHNNDLDDLDDLDDYEHENESDDELEHALSDRDCISNQITDDDLLFSGKMKPKVATLHRGFDVCQAPVVAESDSAVVRHRSGGVASHCQTF